MSARSAILAAALLCGCGEPAPFASLSFAQGEVAAQAKKIQVAFVRATGASLDCSSIDRRCLRDVVSEPEPLLGPEGFEGRRSLLADVSAPSGTQSLRPQVEDGTYLVAVEAISAGNRLLANACAINVTLRSGETTTLRLTLEQVSGSTDTASPAYCEPGDPCDCEPAYP